jgi:hypothetical protein
MWHAWESREECSVVWWGSRKEIDHSEDQGLDLRIGSDFGFWRDWLEGCGMDLVSSGYGPTVGYYECGDEPLGFGLTELVGW